MPKEQKRRDHRTLSCNICNKTFKVYGTWYSHQKQKHEEPNIPCKKCGQKFKTFALRNTHAYKEH